MGENREDRSGGGGSMSHSPTAGRTDSEASPGAATAAGARVKAGDWDHQLELGNDLRTERRLIWMEALVILLVLAVAGLRIFLV